MTPRTPSEIDPVEAKIRQLQQYSSDDDPDSSVRIQALPGSIVNVTAAKDSDPPIIRRSKAAKVVAAVVGALISIGLVAKAMWDAAHP